MQKMQQNQGPKLTPEKAQYLATLMEEKGKLDGSLVHANRILSEEIDRVQTGRDTDKYVEIHTGKPSKMKMRILIPIKEFPKYNFVGKLLGPKGATLKQIQEDTGTKMSILGRGSVRDKKKEEELRKEGGKYNHLNDELHLNVDSFGLPAENYRRFSMVVGEIQRYLIPDEQELFGQQQQFGEPMFLNGENGGQSGGSGGAGGGRGRGRGRGGPMGRGRGAGPTALLGSAPQPRPMLPGASGGARGRGRASAGMGGARAGASMAATRQAAHAQAFEEEAFYQTGTTFEDPYAAQSYGGAEQEFADPYDQGAGDTQYFDYGHGSSARDAGYEDFADHSQWGSTQSSYGKAAGGGGGGRGRGGAADRVHPYGGATRTARY